MRPARSGYGPAMTEPALRGTTALTAALDQISVAELRRRGGLKWTYAGPDVLGAFVAEMDFGTAPAVEAALRDVIARARLRVPSDRPRCTEMAECVRRVAGAASMAGWSTRPGSARCPTSSRAWRRRSPCSPGPAAR